MKHRGATWHPGGWPVTRRNLLIGGSLAAAAMPVRALASDQQVRLAIAKDFTTLAPADGNVAIDMPDFSDSGKSVPLTVTVPCSMQGQDYPELLGIYAARNPRPRVARVYFTPASSKATFSTRVRIDSYQDITAVVRMADGRIFKAVHKVDVTLGACEETVADDPFPPGWKPHMRVAVPDTAKAGKSVEVRTIISHPMETGFRYNLQGLKMPVRIVEWFRCLVNGELAFSAKLEPAISANPYLAFDLRIDRTSDLEFQWVDTSTDVYSTTKRIVVA